MKKKPVIIIRNAKSYDFGGGERFPVFLAETLAKNEMTPIVVSRSKKLLDFANDRSVPSVRGWWWSNQNWSGARVLLFPIYLLWQVVLFFWYLQLFIRKKPMAVHIQSKDDFIAATFAGKLAGARVIWTDHADLKHIWLNVRTWYKNPVGKLVHFAARFADAITMVSQSEKTLVTGHIKNTGVLNKIRVVYNGVEDESALYADQNKEPDFTFCVASRLVTDKGINEVIEAFTMLQKNTPNVKLWLMGDGPEADTFKDKTAGNEQIIFLGHQKRPLEYMARAHVFVHPTYHEGFSVALVEASMLGLPIIATSVGGNTEIIINETTGLLVPAKDSQALRRVMARLYEDAKLRSKLGSSAREQYLGQFVFSNIVSSEFIPLYKGDLS
ncbi:MAG TPA: glycosyltransferase family 4 protein [Candidatus Saccharimonadales bacterium]